MNAVVTKVLSGPHHRSSGYWSVEVILKHAAGWLEHNILYFDSKQQALECKDGYVHVT